jgi:amino acid transporter
MFWLLLVVSAIIIILVYLILFFTMLWLRRSVRQGNSKSALAIAMIMHSLLPFFKNLPPPQDKTELALPTPKKGQRRKGAEAKKRIN